MSRVHKFFHEQPMLVESELFCGRVTIVACLEPNTIYPATASQRVTGISRSVR